MLIRVSNDNKYTNELNYVLFGQRREIKVTSAHF